jgi:hypothetical protein
MSNDDILYHSGLVAQGCWDNLDSYAREAIERAIRMAKEDERKRCCSIIFGLCSSDNVAQRTVDAIWKEAK